MGGCCLELKEDRSNIRWGLTYVRFSVETHHSRVASGGKLPRCSHGTSMLYFGPIWKG